METLQQLSANLLAGNPADDVIEFEGRWYSRGEMKAVADRANALLAVSGIVPDAPVCLISRNRPAVIAALFGLITASRNIRMIYAFQSPAGVIRDVRRLAPAAFVLTAEDFSPELAEALREDGIATVVLDGLEVSAPPGLDRAGPVAAARTYEGDPRIEILTSGTTGPPKQFPIRFDMIRNSIVANNPTGTGTSGGGAEAPPFLLYFPIGNISGIYSTLPVLLNGQRGQLLDRFSIPVWVEYIRKYRPKTHGVPPSMMQALLEADVPAEDLSSLEWMGSGAAPLDPAVQAAFEDRYGIPVIVSYGATEFGGPVCGFTRELHQEFGRSKLGSVGRAFPGCGLRIVDSEDGHVLPANSEGLLEVLSPRIGPDWIHTADIGLIDDDGFFFLMGRADGAIMRGGFKVLPETIEKALLLHPAVVEAAVVAVPDERVGQVPGAAVRLDQRQPAPGIDALAAHLRDHVLATHLPVHWRIVEQLPRNASMKIDRPGIKRLFAES